MSCWRGSCFSWERCCGITTQPLHNSANKFIVINNSSVEEEASSTAELEELLEEEDEVDQTVEDEEEQFYDCHSSEEEIMMILDNNNENINSNIINNSNDKEPDDDIPELDEMFCQLSEVELEIAARTNFHYAQNPQPKQRNRHVKAMCRRYFKSKKTVERALPCMKATIEFRAKQQIDQLRTAFDGVHAYTELEQMLASRKNFVMGYDKDGRSTFHFIPRRTEQHDLEWTLKESLYTMERAIACSKHPRQQVNAVLDFVGFDVFQHSPPLEVGQQFLTLLRHHYVGHFHKIFLLDVPLGFTIVWKIFQNFVGTNTRQKIVVLNGKQKQEVLEEWYPVEEAAPWMLVGGKKNRELDLHEYLYKTPFDRAFDE